METSLNTIGQNSYAILRLGQAHDHKYILDHGVLSESCRSHNEANVNYHPSPQGTRNDQFDDSEAHHVTRYLSIDLGSLL